MSDSTDAALAAEGDHQAFERLYRRYLSRIYTLCVRLSGSPTKGDELTEEVFVRAWDTLPQFRGGRGFGTWLHRLATDVVSSRGLNGEGSAAAVERAGGVTENTFHDADKTDLAEAINRLPAEARRILVLHDIEGYKYEEIAEILGATVGVSKARLHRARVLLRKALAQ
ncbi:MAG: RNA polymerase sigma factor [Actinobacteria bacterium]|nr:RNA polymerase sigma factor [Actinomycetota bacterium]